MSKGFGGKRRASMAHLFVDGVGFCSSSRYPVGAASPYQGRPTRPLEPVECSPAGRPYASRICAHCEGEWERRLRAASRATLERRLARFFKKPVTIVG